MARGVFKGLVTGLVVGSAAAALVSLAVPGHDAASSRAASPISDNAAAPPPEEEAGTVPRSGLPRLRSDSEPAGPALRRAQ